MRIITTLFLVLVAAGLIVAVFWDSINPFKSEVARPELPMINPMEITLITIESEYGKTRLERNQGLWEVAEPYRDRADQELVLSILAGAEKIHENSFLSVEDIEEDGKSLNAYGLGDDRPLRIGFATPQGEIGTFLLGDAAPLTDSMYMQLADQDEAGVFIANSNVRPLVEKPSEAFLDSQVMRISTDAIVKLEFQRGDSTIELQRKDPMTPWLLVKPMEVRADGERVQILMGIYADFKLANVVPPAQEEIILNKLPADVQRIRFSARDETQTLLDPLELTLIPSSEEEFAYAKVSNRPQMYKVPVDMLKVAPDKAVHLRDRRLIRLNGADVEKLSISRGTDEPLRLKQLGQTWFFDTPDGEGLGEMTNQDKGVELFSLLDSTMIYSYVSDSAADHEKFGLSEPVMTVKFEGTELGAKHVDAITMKIGESDQHEREVFVNFDGEPHVYAVERKFYQELYPLADRVKWKKLDIFNIDFHAIQEIEITDREGKVTRINYDLRNDDPEERVKVVSDDIDITHEVDDAKAFTLPVVVSHLNARAWLSDSTQALEVLKNPSLVVKVRSIVPSEEDNTVEEERTYQVSFASTNEASDSVEFYYGVKEGDQDVFLMPRAVYEVLTANSILAR